MNLEILRKRYTSDIQPKRRRKGSKKMLDRVTEFIFPSYQLLEKSGIFKSKKLSKLKSIAANNFLVNCVTAIEIHLKDVILQNSNWNELGFSDLLKEKISLNDAFEIFNKEKVTREYIIAHSISFQNIESINKVFSSLLKADFLKEVENFKVTPDEEEPSSEEKEMSLLERMPDWRKKMASLYELRNAFVHEGKMKKLTHSEISQYVRVCIFFIHRVDYYVDFKLGTMEKE